MKCEHILVPMDFSSGSLHAYEWALWLAQQVSTRLTLLHVVALPHTSDVDVGACLKKLESELKENLATYQKHATDKGVPLVYAYLGHGPPATRIAQAARYRRIDLIVMGTHGRTGLPHLLIGSVAERVIRLAPCPVMVVPRESLKEECT